jgi:hypothetical protein
LTKSSRISMTTLTPTRQSSRTSPPGMQDGERWSRGRFGQRENRIYLLNAVSRTQPPRPG